MNDKERFDLIDRYFKNELSEEELKIFQEKYASESDFAEEVANHEMVNEVIIDAGLIDIKHKLQNIQQGKVPANGKNGNLAKSTIIGSSLGVLGLLFGVWIFTSVPQNNNTKDPNNQTMKPEIIADNSENGAKTHNSKNERNKDSDNSNYQAKNNKINANKRNSKTPNSKEEPRNQSLKQEKLTKANKDDWVNNPSKLLKNSQYPNQPEKTQKIPQDSINSSWEELKQNTSPDCQDVNISLNYNILKTCNDKKNGAIVLDTATIQGGQSPYSFSISNPSNFKTNTAFNNLSRGHYTLYIKDGNDCKSKLTNLYVPAKNCEKKSYTFVPKEEEAWEFPFNNQKTGDIKIYSREGQ